MPMLATSGEYTIAIGMEPFVFEAAPLEQETVAYSFSVVTREGFVVKLLVPALFGIVTLTIGALNLLN